ncbi:hypothetical protein ACH5RR_039879 [Cinchona calisaya]|uniref:Transposase MuDR plant domain-containing protein n=1 Tax=Cinchona calisaya TaxID=153742 RepID=A0ABD2Y208_9GENT
MGFSFPSKDVMKKAIRMHGVNERRDVKFIKDDNDRVRAKCHDPCKWVIYAKRLFDTDTFQVRTYSKRHTCSKSPKREEVDHIKVKVLEQRRKHWKVIGKVKEQFAMLENYTTELLRENPDSTIILRKRTMKLTGTGGGKLLIVVEIDANNGLYPISWALVEIENKDPSF